MKNSRPKWKTLTDTYAKVRLPRLLAPLLLLIPSQWLSVAEELRGNELPTYQETLQTHSNFGRFVFISSEADRIVIDKRRYLFQVVKNDAVTLQAEEKFDKPLALDSLVADGELRRGIYTKGPVLFSLTNAVSNGNVVALVHQLMKSNSFVRIVQVLNKDMEVIAVWEDELPNLVIDYRLGMEPFALSDDGSMVGLGEYGEFVVYDSSGSVRRSVVVNGVFDKERRPRISILDEKENFHIPARLVELYRKEEKIAAARMKEFIETRDRRLAGKVVEIAELDYSNINGIFFLPDKSLNIMLGSRTIVSIDLDSGVSKVHDLAGVLQSSSHQGYELIYQVLCRQWDLYFLTNFRVVHLRMENGLQKISEISINRRADTVNQWNVLPGVGKDRGRQYYIEFSQQGKRFLELGN